jgi:hypothetical protein
MQPWMVDLCGELVALCDRQRIHVGAQPDRTQPAAAAHHADHAGAADAAMGLDAERLQMARDQLGGAAAPRRRARGGRGRWKTCSAWATTR